MRRSAQAKSLAAESREKSASVVSFWESSSSTLGERLEGGCEVNLGGLLAIDLETPFAV